VHGVTDLKADFLYGGLILVRRSRKGYVD